MRHFRVRAAMPSTLPTYSVVGEREQGTLEPVLTTPIRRQESFILGKAVAIMIPTVALSYAMFGLFLAAVRLFANSVIASALFHQGPILLALFLFAPLLAGWSIVVGMAISVRASEIRVAQQLGILASVPLIGLFLLLAVGVISPTFLVAILFAVVLLLIDVRASRLVARMFDQERFIAWTKAATVNETVPNRAAQIDREGDPKRRNCSVLPHPVIRSEVVGARGDRTQRDALARPHCRSIRSHTPPFRSDLPDSAPMSSESGHGAAPPRSFSQS